MFGLFKLLADNKKLEKDNKSLMSDALRHRSSLGGKKMNERKQMLRKKGR